MHNKIVFPETIYKFGIRKRCICL